MTDHASPPPAPRGAVPHFAGLGTGAKAFLILSAALLPLALIAMFAALQSGRTGENSARAQLRVAAAESSRRLAIEMAGDTNAMRSTLAILARDPVNAPSCARLSGVFAPQYAAGTRFAVYDARGTLVCGTAIDTAGLNVPRGSMQAAIVRNRGLLIGIGGVRRENAFVLFPAAFLEEISRPTGFTTDHGARLTLDGQSLTLRQLDAGGPLDRRQRVTTPIGVDDLALEVTVPSSPFTSAVLVAMLLPLLMWAAAALITWFVVDRLLIRPLRGLRASVAAYVPGEPMVLPTDQSDVAAAEIRELGETFRSITQTVMEHEAGLAEGLVRQTKLTREVHHRVKNNLQVIASLINFHSRGATSSEVAAAYASIQRRVDALAVVHRNHFAEMEVSRGLALRSMIGELAANIRATAPEGSSHLGITLEITPFLVSQDTAVAVAFLITELVELAMGASSNAQHRISAREDQVEGRGLVRVVSSAFVASPTLESLLTHRYGRVIEGLSRQLRSKLHHDPMTGAYEISVAVLGIE